MGLLCSLKNVNLTFGTKTIFHNAELSISSGDRIGLIGLNGKGKSTLFKILANEVTPDISSPPFEFMKTRGDDENQRFSIFYVPQELPLFGNENLTIRDYFFVFYKDLKIYYQEDLNKFEELHGWEIISEYESYLKYFGLENLDLKVGSLSGGEQKKILLALGLSSPQNLILWDEPTNHLDIASIQQFEEELLLKKNAFILITHDRYLLSKVTQKIFHISQGSIKTFQGNYTDYLNFLKQSEKEKEALYSRLKNNLTREQAWMNQGIKARGTRSKKRVETYTELKSKVAKIKSEAKKYLELELNLSSRKTKTLVSFESVNFSYPNSSPLFINITGEIGIGKKIGLIGANGVGKTTLLKILMRDLNPSSGIVKRAEGLCIQYFSQKKDELDSDKTPYQILGDGNDFVGLPNGQKKHVHSYFESFLFDSSDIHRPLKTFSGGEKSRLQLAYNLTKPGDILIFDEPTNDLDLETIEILENKLAEFPGAVILISHDRSFLENVTNKVWLLQDQKLENFEGGYQQVAPYLDALELERSIVAEEKLAHSPIPPSATPTTQSSPLTQSIPAKNPQKLESVIQEIESNEQKIGLLNEKISQLDIKKLSDPNNSELKILTDAIRILEERLSSLYQEYEKYD